MLKKIIITTALVAVIGLLIFGAVNRTLAKNGNESLNSGQGGYGKGNVQTSLSSAQLNSEYVNEQERGGFGRNEQSGGVSQNGEAANLPPATPGELSPAESAALLYMREEEKLAHDVYVTFYSQWGLPIFHNISQSELAHTEAVKTLFDRYGLNDPASSTVGVFTNPELQALYNELVAKGSLSLTEALKVGAAIEEIDILDLQERLTQSDNADIQQVFNNLLNGSYNHLRAFASTLRNQTGEAYHPQYLSTDAFETIISTSSIGGGNGNNSGRGGRGGRS